MTITREQLYEQVWAEPMMKVAARIGVSSNYLARVCEHLNVPHPPRGYWAKLKVGTAPKQPPLHEPRAGDEVEWTRGDSVPRPVMDLVPFLVGVLLTAPNMVAVKRCERRGCSHFVTESGKKGAPRRFCSRVCRDIAAELQKKGRKR